MHCHGAATRSVGMLNGIGACFTDGDEQVGNRPRRGTDRQRRIATRISLSDQGNAGTTRSNGPISPLSWRRARRCHRRSAAGAHAATPASDVLCRTLCRLPWVASARSSCSSHISPLSLRIAIQPGLDEPYSYYFQHALYAQAMLDWRNGLVPRALAALQRVSKRLLAMQAMEAAVFVLVDQAALAAEAQDAAAGEDAAAGLALLANDGGLAPLPRNSRGRPFVGELGRRRGGRGGGARTARP